jgi:hypothetical protein
MVPFHVEQRKMRAGCSTWNGLVSDGRPLFHVERRKMRV